MANNKIVYCGETLIDLTGDTVTADKLAQGVTAHDKSGAIITGTSTMDSDTQDATAAVAEILTGKTAYVRGVKLTGTMPNRGAIEGTIAEKGAAFTIPQGYHDGSGRVILDITEKAKVIPSNIKAGVELLGVTGSYTGEAVKAESKTATPSNKKQTVLPGEGFDYLSQVVIAAIPYVETENAAGGKTVTIG